MKKHKYITIIIVLTVFVLFSVAQCLKIQTYDVTEVLSPTEITINNKTNDTLKLLDGYEVITKSNMDTFNEPDNYNKIAFAYLTEKFANDVMLDKKVEYKNKDNKDEIFIAKESYTNIMKKSGYLFKNKKPVNPEAYNKRLEQIKKAQYKIYNAKSNKYHELTCEYGQSARNYVLLSKAQLPKGAKPCKFCHQGVGVNNGVNGGKCGKKVSSKRKGPAMIFTDGPVKVVFNDYTTHLKPNRQGNTAICNELVKHINSAKSTIDIAIYGYDKVPKVENAIKNAIKRGVKVRLVHDIDSKGNNIYQHTDYFAGLIKNVSNDKSVTDTKYSNSIMHNKFYIFDNSVVLTGSANMSFTDMSDFNSNCIIVINSKKIADIYTKEFNQMYNSRFHNLKGGIENKENITLGNSTISIYFSPHDRIIQTKLIPLINNSKKYIYIPTFLITDKNMAAALINARKRGVSVKIIVDATNAKNNSSKHQLLRQNGIEVKTENWAGKLHSKSIIIDDTYTVIGSMNFSKSGELKNDENVVIIKNTKLTQFYKAYFNYLWSRISNYWLTHDVSAESRYSVGSCFDGIDNDYDGKTDLEDEGCKFYKSKTPHVKR